jgi:hypothetical protein
MFILLMGSLHLVDGQCYRRFGGEMVKSLYLIKHYTMKTGGDLSVCCSELQSVN